MKKMGKKIGSIGVCACLLFSLAGCSDGEVDYDLGTEAGSEAAGVTRESSRGLSQYAGADHWTDEFTVASDYTETRICIDADIVIPEGDSMSVVAVKEPEFDEAYKEKIVGTIYGDREVCACVKEPEPSDEMEENGWNFPLEQILADGEFAPAEDYASDVYLGSFEGKEFALRFLTEKWEIVYANELVGYRLDKEITLAPKDYGEVCPEQLQGKSGIDCFPGNEENASDNVCELDSEAAQALAQKTLSNLGFTDYALRSERPLIWEGDSGFRLTDGYVFNFVFSIGGQPVEGNEGYSLCSRKADKWQDVYGEDGGATVYVSDGGVVWMQVIDPVEVTDVASDVMLLSLESIEGIFASELDAAKKNGEFYPREEYRFNLLKLTYLRVEDDSERGSYSYLPVWKLCYEDAGQTCQNVFYLNAIDGSVVYRTANEDIGLWSQWKWD